MVEVMALARVSPFQSTLPRGSDCCFTIPKILSWLFQSTLPRGSDPNPIVHTGDVSISIHAPSRERPLTRPIIQPCSVFQSTLPRGSDRLLFDHFQAMCGISIHAPSRERHSRQHLRLPFSDFNPRSLAGATVVTITREPFLIFQSTLPRGSDSNKQIKYR